VLFCVFLCFSMYILFLVVCFFCVVLCIVVFVSFSVLFVCICVLNYCHWVATQLQFTNISYHIISYHIIRTWHINQTQLLLKKKQTAVLYGVATCFGSSVQHHQANLCKTYRESLQRC
jgi:hypothetical protein